MQRGTARRPDARSRGRRRVAPRKPVRRAWRARMLVSERRDARARSRRSPARVLIPARLPLNVSHANWLRWSENDTAAACQVKAAHSPADPARRFHALRGLTGSARPSITRDARTPDGRAAGCINEPVNAIMPNSSSNVVDERRGEAANGVASAQRHPAASSMRQDHRVSHVGSFRRRFRSRSGISMRIP